MRRYLVPCAVALSIALGLSACTDPYDPGQRAAGGGLLGAGAGAAIGGAGGGARGGRGRGVGRGGGGRGCVGWGGGGGGGGRRGGRCDPPAPAAPFLGPAARLRAAARAGAL